MAALANRRSPRRKPLSWASFLLVAGAVAWLALPHHPGYQEWRCRGQTLEGLQALERRLPESPIVHYYLGRALHQAGRSAEAVPRLQRAAQLDRHSVRVYQALAEAQLAAGQTRETFDLLRQFLETHPEIPEAYQMLARFLLGVRTYSRAILILEEATRRFPNDGESWKLLANAREQFRDFQGAREAAKRATALRPNDADAFLLQARIFRDGGMREARAAYEQAMRLAPDDVELRAEFADYLARKAEGPQDTILATDLARSALLESPGNHRALAALGLALAERGLADEAIPRIHEAITQAPQDARLLRALSRLYHRKGDAAEAARWTEKAGRAQAYRDAQKRLLDALEMRPKDEKLLREMAQLTGRHGDALTSARYYGIAFGQPPDAAAPLLATAHELKNGGFIEAARQIAERALLNSRAAKEREAARTFLTTLRGL